MKVWELISKLSEMPAGADVIIIADNVENAHQIISVVNEEGQIELRTSAIN